MKDSISKKKKLNLYQKERLVLGTLLLCFALSGFGLPRLKMLTTQDLPDSNDEIITVPEDEPSSDIKLPEAEPDTNVESPEIETPPEESVSTDSPIEAPEDNPKEEPTEKPIEKPVEKPTDKPTEKPSTSQKPDTTDKTEEPKEPEKVWVPPVYEIVHHEAVYETVKVVICNYCSEEFSTVGEFQVHKDAHGG